MSWHCMSTTAGCEICTLRIEYDCFCIRVQGLGYSGLYRVSALGCSQWLLYTGCLGVHAWAPTEFLGCLQSGLLYRSQQITGCLQWAPKD